MTVPIEERGQATVELALALPLLALLLLLVADVGLVVRDQVLVVQAAREAARQAAVDDDPQAARRAALATGPLDPTRLGVTATAAGGRVTVVVSYRSAPNVPIIRGIAPVLRLEARCTMRLEN